MTSTMKTVKRIIRPRFEIALVETSSGQYRVCHYNRHTEKETTGEAISDYTLAAHVFDLKLAELEGN